MFLHNDIFDSSEMNLLDSARLLVEPCCFSLCIIAMLFLKLTIQSIEINKITKDSLKIERRDCLQVNIKMLGVK